MHSIGIFSPSRVVQILAILFLLSGPSVRCPQVALTDEAWFQLCSPPAFFPHGFTHGLGCRKPIPQTSGLPFRYSDRYFCQGALVAAGAECCGCPPPGAPPCEGIGAGPPSMAFQPLTSLRCS